MFLQSSLMGHEFVKYRNNHTLQERDRQSKTIRMNIDEIPVVIDSVDIYLSEMIAGPNSRRFDRNGKLYHFHKDVLVDDILAELRQRIKLDNKVVLKVGLENGRILKGGDSVEELYNRYKDQKDCMLYLLLTKETSMYGYIVSLLRYIFGERFIG